jgi:hypothetical protein
VANDDLRVFYVYDRNARTMKKIEAQTLEYKYDYKKQQLACNGKNIQMNKLQKTNNKKQIDQFVADNNNIFKINDNESSLSIVCVEVDRNLYNDALELLDTNRFKYDI